MGATRHTPIHSLTLSGNTAGALQLISSGTVTLAGGNNITLSQNGNAVTISGAAAAGAQTAISGISASDTLYTSGTVRFTGVGGGITVSSNTGQRVDLSVAAPVAQSVQTQNVVDLTLSGNTAGALALVSSGTLTLAGGNNITLSQAGNAVTISGPNVAGAQTGISGLANSQTTYTSGTVSFSELGAITIRSTTGQQFQFSVNSQTAQTQDVVDMTLSGNTAGALALISSGTVTLAGGNNVTLSQAGNAVTISAAAQSVQPETQTFIAGISASNTLYTSGNVRFTGSQAVTVRSGTGQLVVIDAPAQSVQAETQTFLAGAAASNTTYTSGTFTITGVGGGITVSSNTGQRIDLSVAAPVAQTTQTQGILSMGVSTGGNTIGNTQVSTGSRMVIVASGNMTASQATAAGASTITLSVAAQSVQPETQTFIAGISASDTLYTSGNVRITGVGGGITVSSNTGQRIDLSVAAQTNQTGTIYAASNTTGTSSGTYDARTLSIAGDGIISVAASNSGWRISATQSVQTQNVHNVTLSGNTAGAMAQISSGTMTLAGGNNITLSQAGNAVTISAGAGGGFSAGVSTGGNTAGATGVTGTRLVLVGTNNVTLSQTTDANGGTISISAAGAGAGQFSGGVSNLGNTAGSTGITGTQNVLVGSGVMSLSQSTGANGATITISAPVTSSLSATGAVEISTNGSTISIGAPLAGTMSMWPAQPQSTNTAAIIGGWTTGATRSTYHGVVFPMAIEHFVSFNQMRGPAALSVTSATTTANWSHTNGLSFGIYTLTGGTLSLLSSFSNQARISYNSAANSTNASATWQMSWGSGTDFSSSRSLSTNNAGATSLWSSISSIKMFPLATGAMSISPGQYWGVQARSEITSGVLLATLTHLGYDAFLVNTVVGEPGRAVASSTGQWPLMGIVTMTQTDTALQASFATAGMTTASNNASWVNRSWAVQMMSQF